jgi:hypothetical protein
MFVGDKDLRSRVEGVATSVKVVDHSGEIIDIHSHILGNGWAILGVDSPGYSGLVNGLGHILWFVELNFKLDLVVEAI